MQIDHHSHRVCRLLYRWFYLDEITYIFLYLYHLDDLNAGCPGKTDFLVFLDFLVFVVQVFDIFPRFSLILIFLEKKSKLKLDAQMPGNKAQIPLFPKIGANTPFFQNRRLRQSSSPSFRA